MEKVLDFIVIGGGPAGSTIATQLSRKGYTVTVFEKEKFPREHVGESLLPFCYQMLDEMEILDDMKKHMVRKPGVMFISADGQKKNTYCFNKVIHDESALSFHVLRAEFDDMLLKNSRKFGATVYEETKVTAVELNRPDETVKVEVMDTSGTTKIYFAKQLIDASGQDTFLSKKLNNKKTFDSLDRIAFATHWMLDSMPEYIDVGIQPIVYLGGDKAGWIFVIPVGVNRISVGVVVNNKYVRTVKPTLDKSENWQEAFYMNELNSSPYVMNLLKNAKRREGQPLMVVGDYSYYTDVKYGNDFALTGDSSAFLDPIFSSGVYLSMKTSFILAEAYDKKFKGGNMKDNSALKEAFETIDGAYKLIAKFIYYFYNAKALNLAELNNTNMELSDHVNHETAFQLLHYLLAGDFFAEHEKYNEMIDLLQDPKHFMRFKNFALDKHDRNTTTCNYTTADSYSRELMDAFMEGNR
ncbi:MAG TPA: NAD(P)/FAD-dependent oxidoreductase [Bacteroidia bacterium]|nr:NAD(P)/FAD-dependent oxidoreductase [Bacteroidia bacterium]